ncbi:SRPBCC family protein [Nocardioides sp. NPDC126508]
MGNTCTIHTSASAAEAFGVVADLSSYGSWLPRSVSYRGTDLERTSASPLLGTRYADRTPLGQVEGVVTEVEMGRRIRFRQALRDRSLSIDITYEFEDGIAGSMVRRTGIIEVAGRIRPIAWIVVPLTRAENRRTMRALRRHLAGLSPADAARPR